MRGKSSRTIKDNIID